MARLLLALVACASASMPAPLSTGGAGGAMLDPLESSRFSTAVRKGAGVGGAARVQAGGGGGKLPKWLEKPPYWCELRHR